MKLPLRLVTPSAGLIPKAFLTLTASLLPATVKPLYTVVACPKTLRRQLKAALAMPSLRAALVAIPAAERKAERTAVPVIPAPRLVTPAVLINAGRQAPKS